MVTSSIPRKNIHALNSLYMGRQFPSVPVLFAFLLFTFMILRKLLEGIEENLHHGVFILAIKEPLERGGGFNIVDMDPQVKLLELITRMRAKLEKLHGEIDKTTENIINEHKESKKAATTHKQDYEEDDHVDILLRIQAK
ncbi:hypothetical protein RJ641_000519, partial [Dillenia turbinata]